MSGLEGVVVETLHEEDSRRLLHYLLDVLLEFGGSRVREVQRLLSWMKDLQIHRAARAVATMEVLSRPVKDVEAKKMILVEDIDLPVRTAQQNTIDRRDAGLFPTQMDNPVPSDN